MVFNLHERFMKSKLNGNGVAPNGSCTVKKEHSPMSEYTFHLFIFFVLVCLSSTCSFLSMICSGHKSVFYDFAIVTNLLLMQLNLFAVQQWTKFLVWIFSQIFLPKRFILSTVFLITALNSCASNWMTLSIGAT